MDRQESYLALVERRRRHRFPEGLLNPSEIEGGRFDSDHLGPWSRWQGDLRARVLIVGQDWGDLPYFLKNKGVDDEREQTCTNLRAMAHAAGWDLGSPRSPNPQPLYFTNAVLGIRAANGKSGAPLTAWIDDSLPFMVEIIDLIQPKVVVSLGTAAYRSTRLALYGRTRDDRIPIGAALGQVHHLGLIQRPGKPAWFPYYHCGPLGLVNRSRELQIQDWEQLGAWVRQHEQ